MSEAISSIQVGADIPVITFDSPAAVQAALMSIAGLNVEVSGAIYAVPCNEALEIDPNIDRAGPLIIHPDYKNLLVLGIIIPKQSGTYASSVFEVSDADEEAERVLAPLYPFLKGRCGKFNLGWIHTHPKDGSVFPSQTDVTSFKEKSDGKPIYVKVIINNMLVEKKFSMSENLFVRVKLSGSVYAPTNFRNTEHGIMWTGAIGIEKNPFIQHVTFTKYRTAEGVEVNGLEPSNWFIYNPRLYKDIITDKNSTTELFECWGMSEVGPVPIVGVPAIKKMLQPTVTYSNTYPPTTHSNKGSKNKDKFDIGFKW